MYIFECLYLKYVLQKRKLDRDSKKGAKHKHWKQKQNKTCACELYLFVILIRALFQRLLLTKFQESVKPKNKFTGISFEFKQKSLEFKKKQKNKSDQIWSNLIKFDDLIRFDQIWSDLIFLFFLILSDFFWIQVSFFWFHKFFSCMFLIPTIFWFQCKLALLNPSEILAQKLKQP